MKTNVTKVLNVAYDIYYMPYLGKYRLILIGAGSRVAVSNLKWHCMRKNINNRHYYINFTLVRSIDVVAVSL